MVRYGMRFDSILEGALLVQYFQISERAMGMGSIIRTLAKTHASVNPTVCCSQERCELRQLLQKGGF